MTRCSSKPKTWKQSRQFKVAEKYGRTKKSDRQQFEEAVRFFIRAMRIRTFVSAANALVQKHGGPMSIRVEMYCFNHRITYRGSDGRLYLASRYKRGDYRFAA
jgi:hypothetical protein